LKDWLLIIVYQTIEWTDTVLTLFESIVMDFNIIYKSLVKGLYTCINLWIVMNYRNNLILQLNFICEFFFGTLTILLTVKIFYFKIFYFKIFYLDECQPWSHWTKILSPF